MEKIDFKDYPNLTTPIDSNNLNQLQKNTEKGITEAISGSIVNSLDGNEIDKVPNVKTVKESISNKYNFSNSSKKVGKFFDKDLYELSFQLKDYNKEIEHNIYLNLGNVTVVDIRGIVDTEEGYQIPINFANFSSQGSVFAFCVKDNFHFYSKYIVNNLYCTLLYIKEG